MRPCMAGGTTIEYGGDARVEAEDSVADDAAFEVLKVPGAARNVAATEVEKVVVDRTVVDKEPATEVASSATDKGMDYLEEQASNSSGVRPARMRCVPMTRMQRARRTKKSEEDAQVLFDAGLFKAAKAAGLCG